MEAKTDNTEHMNRYISVSALYTSIDDTVLMELVLCWLH